MKFKFLILISLLWARPMQAGPAGALYLLEDPGARSSSLGGATAASAWGVESLRSNPAGLSGMQSFEVALAHHLDSFGWNHDWLAVGLPVGAVTLGMEALVSRLDPIPDYDMVGNQIGTINIGSEMAGLGAAMRFFGDTLSLGLSVRGFLSQVAQYGNSGFAADLGAQARLPWLPLELGVSVQNLGMQSAYVSRVSPLPMGSRMALSWMAFDRGSLSLKANGEYDYFPDAASMAPFKAGLEAGVGAGFFVATGLQSSQYQNTFSFGGSYQGRNLQVAYSFVPNTLLGPSHLLSLKSTGLFGWGEKSIPELSENDISINDIKGLPQVKEWTLEIVSKGGLIKKTLKGKGALPTTLLWKLDSKSGDSLRSSITDSFGVKSISLQPLTSVIQPREIQHSAPLFAQSSDGKGGLRLNTQLERDISNIKEWKLQIFTKDGSLVKELSAKGILPRTLSWDGKDAKGVNVLDDREFNYVFTADGGEGMNMEVSGSIAKAIKPREFLMKPPSFDPSTKIIAFMPETKLSVKVKEWILSIKAADGVVIKTLTGKGPLPREFKFDPSLVNMKGLDLTVRKSGLAYIQYAINIIKTDGSNQVISDVLPLPASDNAKLEGLDALSQGDFKPVAGRELLLLIEPRFISMQVSSASSATLLFKLPEGRETKAWKLEVQLEQEPWTVAEGKGTPPACLSWKGAGKNGDLLNASSLAGASLRLVVVSASGEDTVLPEVQPMNRSFKNCDDSKKMRRVHAAWFSKGESELQSEMMERLDRVADLVKASPSLKLIVQGHCSKEGDENTNAKLSEARAQAVRHYLEEDQGIDAARLSAVGFSNQMLLDFSGDEDAVRRNRRADVILFE